MFHGHWLDMDELLKGASSLDVDWVPARIEGRGVC